MSGYDFKKKILNIFFTFTNSEDPDEMPHYGHFIWVYTVCKSTPLGVSRMQRVKYLNMSKHNPRKATFLSRKLEIYPLQNIHVLISDGLSFHQQFKVLVE